MKIVHRHREYLNLTRKIRAALPCLLMFAISQAVHAQSSAEVNAAGLQFNLSDPGARSLGLGGAFTGLADDATASYANPAGLTNLSIPEISIEGRYWNFSNFYTDRGHAFGPPSMMGIDTLPNVHHGESRDQALGVSFLSLVYPHTRWSA